MALRRIALHDFVIVTTLELEVKDGFTVLTGETGAGKSILIDALQLVLGARADTGVIRETAGRTDLSAEFDAPAGTLAAWLEEAGFPAEESLLLRRTIDTQGKSRAWINGVPATATQMRALGEMLIDIHGQHAWQSLTRGEAVRGLLDAYAGVDSAPLALLWKAWRSAQAQLEQARAAQGTLQQERERLQWQIDEVSKLAPVDGEWDQLNQEHRRLASSEALLAAAQLALQALQGGDDEGGALHSLAHAQQAVQQHAQVEPEFASLCTTLASSMAEAQDAAHQLHGYLRHADPDPARIQQLDERLSLWLQLARRYRRTPEELPGVLAGWKLALQQLDAAADLRALAAAEHTHQSAYEKTARTLSRARAKAAPLLASAITHAMQGLGMAGGQFEVALSTTEPGMHGMDQVQFLVASHPGMTPRPIGKVASGGELSRIALAIAVTTSRLGEVPTLIFDEVDSGVGGAVAQTVGRLMRQLGRDRQVLAVTHLPQVAACGDQHWVVAKHSSNAQTTSSVAPVQGQQRTQEIARMLGGEHLSPTTIAHATEMLGSTAKS